jgi:sugar phosphate permease
MGFPVVAKSLTYWYSNNERGMKWSLWSTSHQTGTFLSVVISGFLIARFGWQAAFFIPAIISVMVSIFLFNRLRDKPTTIGLPDIEEYREPERCAERKADPSHGEDDDKTYFDIFKKYILCNKTMWMLAIAYIFVYVIRFGTEDWVVKYLVEAKKNSLQTAAWKLSFLPLFGIIGTISAGYFSDKIFKGKRTPINVLFLGGVILAILGLKYNTVEALDFVFLGLIGIFTYGPQMLIGGLCAVESSSKKVASAATGFTGSFGYVGAMLSGVGTGTVIDKFGWNGALYFWIASAVLCMLILLPMWNHKSSCK